MIKIINEMSSMSNKLNINEVNAYINLMSNSSKKLIVGCAAGRMGYSLRAHIMRLSHIGYNAYFIGDTSLPRIDEDSIVIINSSSGETETNILYAQQAKKAGSTIVTFTCNDNSTIGQLSDVIVKIPVIKTEQIMKSVYEQFTFLLLDYLAQEIIRRGNLDINTISMNHSILE